MPSSFLEDFGQAVRQLRKERGMTQAELAERLKLSRTSITNIEKGQQNPPLSLLPEIANALGVDIARLFALSTSDSDGTSGLDTLASQVPDEDLRRWAGQIIGDTLASQPQKPKGRISPHRRPQ